MIEYIKGPYVSPISGVINTETGWRVTTDKAGLHILDEVEMSSEVVDSYFSNILVPKNEEVYIWYQMKMNNGEIKEWAGPFPYQSRDSNISNDLKPLLRVETPYPIMKKDSLSIGNDMIKIESSVFRGDPLDGILASTWIVKNPKGEILAFYPNDSERVNEITLNRAVLGLDRYEYIDVYLQHHSANGSISNFGVVRFDLRVFPFKYSGAIVVDNTIDYKFSIIPYNSSYPGLKNIRLVEAKTGKKIYEITDVSTLEYIIPPYTMVDNREYVLECYTISSPDLSFPLKLNVNIKTSALGEVLEYIERVDYDLGIILPKTFTSTDAKGEYRLVNDIAYVLNRDLSISRYTVDKLAERFDISTMSIDADVVPYLTDDSKLFNLRSGKLILVSRVENVLNFVPIRIVADRVCLDLIRDVTTYPVDDIEHNISNTATLSLDDNNIYISVVSEGELHFLGYNVYNTSISELPVRDRMDISTYNPSSMLLIANGLDTIFSIGGNVDDDTYYEYIIKSGQWIPRGILDTEDIVLEDKSAILLQNKSTLFLNNDDNDRYMITIDSLNAVHTTEATQSITTYDLSFIDVKGTLYLLSFEARRIIVVKPKALEDGVTYNRVLGEGEVYIAGDTIKLEERK